MGGSCRATIDEVFSGNASFLVVVVMLLASMLRGVSCLQYVAVYQDGNFSAEYYEHEMEYITTLNLPPAKVHFNCKVTLTPVIGLLSLSLGVLAVGGFRGNLFVNTETIRIKCSLTAPYSACTTKLLLTKVNSRFRLFSDLQQANHNVHSSFTCVLLLSVLLK